MLVVSLIVIFFGAYFLKQLRSSFRYRDFNGPSPLKSLPLIGHGYMVGPNLPKRLLEIRKQYGDIFRFDLGASPTVHLCTHDLVSKAFRLDAFNGKSSLKVIDATTKKDYHGENAYLITRSNHGMWFEQRRFMTRTLNEMTAGDKETMEDVISQEAEELVNVMLNKLETKFHSHSADILPKAVSNVIWRISLGEQVDSGQVRDLVDTITAVMAIMTSNTLGNLLQKNSLWVTKLLSFFGKPNFLDGMNRLGSLAERMVKPFGPHPEGNYFERGFDYCDKSSGRNRYLNADSGKLYMEAAAMVFFIAGTDTSANALMWALLYMIKYPETQDRLFAEVTAITSGNNRKIRLKDQSEAHFTNSFITEVVRHSPSRVLFPNHETTEDVVFEGKFFPKGTQIYAAGYCINHDPATFPEPHLFLPDRFLDKNGRFTSDSAVLLFGLGKRRCPGEALARAELFIMLATLVQKLRFEAVVPREELDVSYSGTHHPKPFRFTVASRENTQ